MGAVPAVIALVVLYLAVRRARRVATRVLAATATALLALASAAVGVNAHYGYFATVGEAFGGTGPDSSTLAAAEAGSGRIPPNGQVITLDLPGTTSGFTPRQAVVYLPPAWFARPRPALPVIMLLHGTPGDPTSWTDGGGAQTTADAWAAQHGGTAPVLVMPDINGSLTGDTECVDSPLGRAETYLTVDVPAAVQQQLGTAPPGRQWAVAGLSEGGSCAIVLALRHPDGFAAFGDYGGLAGPRVGDTNDDTADTVTQLFGGSQAQFSAHEPAALLGAQRFPDLGGWFQVGTGDAEPLAAAQRLAPLARAAGVQTCLVTMPGLGHTFDVWSAAFGESLPFLAARIGLVPPDPSQTAACAPA
ncbi:alpha/beta hydrolase [Pseudonocardia humida]|uniref:alpha/beta hydrolase n=1 Tax=Pseudonocardia humida TaxID=2800819 RepID=UPI00207CCA2C|nr:alpha/beta hydrolase-fold protein [Pseudonocardia humida]